MRLISLAALAAVAGCGGGGDSGTGSAATELAFTVRWQQPVAAAALSSSEAAPPALGFETPIPAAVNSIRFILRPESGADCCIAVARGSEAFIERHIVLADVPEGDATLEVHGFPTGFAPAGGVTNVCPTRVDQGEQPCAGDDSTLPSFGSDQTPVDVVRGERNVVNVDVYSLPFLLDLEPDNGETVGDVRPRISFAVVDANFDIEFVSVLLRQSPLSVVGDLRSVEPCRDDDPELPDCSNGGALDVQGLLVVARPTVDLPPGETELEIEATNTGDPQRDMQSNTTFVIQGEVTTTTTVTTTSTTVTTTSSSTTIDTTTTTLGGGEETFCLRFSVSNDVDLVGLSYTVSYGSTGGDFAGSGENVDCESQLQTSSESTFASFNDDDGSQLFTAVISGETFSAPLVVATCTFLQVPPLNLNALSIQVTEATAPDLSPANATVVVEEIPCSL